MAADRSRAFEIDSGPEASRPPAVAEAPEAFEAAPLSSAPAASRSLLTGQRPPGRGAHQGRIAAVQRLQQAHGNRLTQRFMQRAAGPTAPAVDGEQLARRIEAEGGRGAVLDGPVREQLEAGLGADLSGVRVHTDAEADRLSRSVDAVAFTTGPDIFFRSGAYNPGSTAGLHLLAHEATHAVQQAAGAVPGTSLAQDVTISDPADEAERSAARAADAVVAGRPAGATPAGVARSLMRVPAGDMAKAADEAEAEAAKEAAQGREDGSALITTITNIGDVSQAARVRDEIIAYRPNMSKGKADGEHFITSAQFDANESAITVLDQYVGSARMQGSTLGDFQGQMERMHADYRRLMGQIQAYAATPQGQGTNDSSDPTAVARAQIASTGKSTEQLQADFRKATTGPQGSGNTGEHQEAAARWLSDIKKESQAVGRTQGEAVAAEHNARSTAEELAGVLAKQQIADKQGQIEALKAKAADAKEAVGLIGDFVKTGTKLGVAAATGGVTAGAAVEEGVGLAIKVAEYAASHRYDQAISDIKAGLAPLQAAEAQNQISAAVEKAAGAKQTYVNKCQEYVDATNNLEHAQDEYRRAMREMGASADAAVGGGAGGRFEVIAQILAEAEAYLGQADATLAIGQREVDKSKETTSRAASVQNKKDGREAGTSYYRPYQAYTQGTLSYRATQQTFRLYLGTDDGHTGSAEGEEFGVNPVMKRAMEELTKQRDEVRQHANTLRQVFNTQAR